MTPTKLLTTAIALSFAFAAQTSADTTADLITFAEISDTRPGNITVTPDNRVIITQQPLDGPTLRVVEVLEDGTKVPFPTQDWADGFAFAPDGTMYIVANQLHTHPALNMGDDGSDHSYVILTAKP